MVEPARRWPVRGLYAITDGASSAQALAERVAAWIAGGARVVQYRDKSPDAARRLMEARALRAVCREAGVPLLINDDVALAATVGADGVHLGRDDVDPAQARAQLGAGALIGVSCYADLEQARAAVAHGADYVAFGRFFASATKPDAPPAPLEVLQAARAALAVPIVAIGGITPDNAPVLIAAGADLVAVIGGLTGADPAARARAYAERFTTAGGASFSTGV
ncbi:MAG TPA: thiamine phosphate synthase [Candidatus Macondimonas sp.]|nr:thiamine phosphate synthase [Candidatus Macondimonas sp.]